MSITIKGATSGGVDIVAPASGSDVTLTLPSTTGTVETTASSIASSRLTGALPAISGASLTNLPAGGVDGIVSSADATAITIDSSENVSVGGTPASLYSGYSSLQIGGNATIFGQTAAGGSQNMWLSQNSRAGTDGSEKAITTGMSSQVLMANGEVVLKVAPSATADANVSWTTAMTIDNSGGVEFISTNDKTRDASVYIETSVSDWGIQHNQKLSSSIQWFESFLYNGSLIGNITGNGSATSYNTSSDYRLKENLVPITDSIERVKSLKPYRFNFIADPDTTVDGFVAHEAGEVVPEAVSGEKDAMTMEEYEVTPAVMGDDGMEVEPAVMGEREVIDPQGIDQAKLVPLLTAALQDAIKRIEILENA